MIDEYGEFCGMRIDRENWSTRKKNRPSATLSTTNPTWTDLSSNPYRRIGKSAANRLSYATAFKGLTKYPESLVDILSSSLLVHNVTDLFNALPGNSSVNTVQHATIEEALFSVDPTDVPIDWLDCDHVICVYCKSMSVPQLYKWHNSFKEVTSSSSGRSTLTSKQASKEIATGIS
jgi:hypothetical protein